MSKVDSWRAPADFNYWVVYENPTDFPPGTFVARKWKNYAPTLLFKKSMNYEDLRISLENDGFQSIGRHPQDDPAIMEVWI